MLAAFEQTVCPTRRSRMCSKSSKVAESRIWWRQPLPALRGLPGPTGRIIPYLLRAIENMRLATTRVVRVLSATMATARRRRPP